MKKSIISLILLWTWASAATAATSSDLAVGAPDRYVVVPGDTLWSIAGRFLKSPWKWGELWKLNQEQIKNPHRIYPGDVLVLDRSASELSMRLLKSQTVKLSPQARSTPIPPAPIPTIPIADIEPFLSKPLVIAPNQFANAARIVRTQESRVALGMGSIAYAQGVTKEAGPFWQIFRPGTQLIDPETKESLGQEAVYLGDARVERYGDVSTLEIVKSLQEIYSGDYLVPAPRETALADYVPRAPGRKVNARIISAYGGLYEVGTQSIVTLNKGVKDGLEPGHVLAIYRDQNATSNYSLREAPLWGSTGLFHDEKNPKTNYVNEPLNVRNSPLWGRTGPTGYKYKDDTKLPSPPLPEERYGLMMIFRVFDRAAYALVLNSTRPVHVFDTAKNP